MKVLKWLDLNFEKVILCVLLVIISVVMMLAVVMRYCSDSGLGVKAATVAFMAQKMYVEFDEGADESAVMKDVLKNCKRVEDDCEIYL